MPNRLARSTSPYLRQHQDNPVDWYEWGEEAFAEARRRDVPLLLSVGYSSCHWCHVMAHESFEDPDTAAVMNELFVNVKVDREERPDVDAIYMEAVQAMTGQGGWPMTVWITPDARPFFAGTYFPATDMGRMPAFRTVMGAVADAWRNRRSDVLSQADQLTEAVSRSLPPGQTMPGEEALRAAYRTLEESFDETAGGFGGAPKFPQEPTLELLLRILSEPWAPRAGAMLSHTLHEMASGGIYDQVGGGFARYSVDAGWTVPHFEKMLYTNAQLARLYAWAWREVGDERFRRVAEETLEYLRRDLRHPDGGFFSAEDADSDGVEGTFYVWSEGEFLETTGDDALVAASHHGVTAQGNFEGANVLTVARPVAELAADLGRSEDEVSAALARARNRLFERRQTRNRPGLDHKVVASWNGLALRAFAEAGATLGRPDLLDDARACARFVLDRLRGPDGGLLRSWSEGEAKITGFLEDHASMAMGLFALYQATGELEWYRHAETLTRRIPEAFLDPDGGFFTTADDAEPLLKRPKDQMDNPLPSGNSLAAEALLTLSLYTGEAALRHLAETTVQAGGAIIEQYPSAAGHLAAVLHSMLRGTREVAIVGPDAHHFSRVASERYRPHVVVAASVDGSGADAIPLLADRPPTSATRAFVCQDFVCDLPVDSEEELRDRLG